MASFLLTWNPKRWHWENFAGFMDAFKRGEVSTNRWSCGQEEWIRVNAGDRFALPEEIVSGTTFVEGAKRIVAVNSYERSSTARNACIAHYGTRCVVCSFNFAETYGTAGEGLIHVHHSLIDSITF